MFTMPTPVAHSEPAPLLLKTTCIRIDRHLFQVEIAETPDQQEQGLQYRSLLPMGRGMIFPYPSPQTLTFWMKDCKISLDILFFKHGVLVDYVDSAPPCQQEASQCPLYQSRFPADAVVELKAGSRRIYSFQPFRTHMTACPNTTSPIPL